MSDNPVLFVLEAEENSASPFGVRSRLPAMCVNLDSDMNRSLIDLTPSGEVQMRVNREKDDEFTTPRAQAGATEKSMQISTESTSQHNDEGCSTVRVERNGCVDTMTPPVRRTTNAVAWNQIYSETSSPTLNDNSISNCVPQVTEPSVHFKNKKTITFDGTGSWQDFLVQFELISTVDKWDNGMKAYELATS
ncbi:unnamed protein product [Mytilus coruscus]|uniref:Uncharacterized protein n=1 Tax=Mytilus coruscus TaxID=42192 RepID=A0A6J8E5A9_MYTCO|nr:unnamed protein product [Mytilus coruscus]